MPDIADDIRAEYSPVINWLRASQEPWVVYNTLLELIGAEPDSAEVKTAYKAMQTHSSVVALLESLARRNHSVGPMIQRIPSGN